MERTVVLIYASDITMTRAKGSQYKIWRLRLPAAPSGHYATFQEASTGSEQKRFESQGLSD